MDAPIDRAIETPRPHDLLFLRPGAAFEPCSAGTAAWLDAAWLAQAPLVVRRATVDAGRAPVGARGLARNQRCAGTIALAAVARRVTPEDLAQGVLMAAGVAADRLAGAAAALPCVAAVLALAPRLAELGLDWGPAGGAGFWLASGLPVLGPGSDLDLLVRVPHLPARETLAALCALQDRAACRIDVQLDNGIGGFALQETARGGKVLLKTAAGPLLVANPWDAPAARSAA
jgi:phosphoribosyl-dephospho-CoA transferase